MRTTAMPSYLLGAVLAFGLATAVFAVAPPPEHAAPPVAAAPPATDVPAPAQGPRGTGRSPEQPADAGAGDSSCRGLDPQRYPWLADMDADRSSLDSLCARWTPPEGYRRLPLDEATFGSWLRGLPIHTDRRTVRAYDGRSLRAPSAGVVALDLLPGNVQQCADTILRLRAEHAWHRDRAHALRYHFTSGDAVAWSDWLAGERYRVDGAELRRVYGTPRKRTHDAFRRWQRRVFLYAGTRSLRLDSDPVDPEAALRPGDFFVDPGSPGHAVILLDVAEGPRGRRVALIGQGFMPAQELHVLRRAGRVWLPLPDAGGELRTPAWQPFPRGAARRF